MLLPSASWPLWGRKPVSTCSPWKFLSLMPRSSVCKCFWISWLWLMPIISWKSTQQILTVFLACISLSRCEWGASQVKTGREGIQTGNTQACGANVKGAGCFRETGWSWAIIQRFIYLVDGESLWRFLSSREGQEDCIFKITYKVVWG